MSTQLLTSKCTFPRQLTPLLRFQISLAGERKFLVSESVAETRLLPQRVCQANSLPNTQVGERRGRAKDQRRWQTGESRPSNVEEMANGPAYNRTGQGRVRRRR